MSDSVRPHRRQPTRLLHPWDSPGKNTGVGCHFLLPCMKMKRESEVTQWCLTCSDPMYCSLPGSSTHGIFQARVLEWVALAFSARRNLLISKDTAERTQDIGRREHSNKEPWIRKCSQVLTLEVSLGKQQVHINKNRVSGHFNDPIGSPQV